MTDIYGYEYRADELHDEYGPVPTSFYSELESLPERESTSLYDAHKAAVAAVQDLFTQRLQLQEELAEAQAISRELLEALKMVRTDFLEFEGCYCGQIVGGSGSDGEPLNICGWCTTEAAIAKARGVLG